MSEKERKNREELFKLVQENPDLPIVAMVDYEVVGDDSGRWLGSWGSSRIEEYLMGEERIHFRDDDDPSEIEKVLSEKYGYDRYMDMNEEQEKEAYANMPWIKGIVVNIDLPE